MVRLPPKFRMHRAHCAMHSAFSALLLLVSAGNNADAQTSEPMPGAQTTLNAGPQPSGTPLSLPTMVENLASIMKVLPWAGGWPWISRESMETRLGSPAGGTISVRLEDRLRLNVVVHPLPQSREASWDGGATRRDVLGWINIATDDPAQWLSSLLGLRRHLGAIGLGYDPWTATAHFFRGPVSVQVWSTSALSVESNGPVLQVSLNNDKVQTSGSLVFAQDPDTSIQLLCGIAFDGATVDLLPQNNKMSACGR